MEHTRKIQFATPEDAEALLEIYAPYVRDTAISLEEQPPSAEEFRSRIARTLSRYPYLVLRQDGQTAGYCYASAFHPRSAYRYSAELSIYLRPECRGQGGGAALYRQMEELLRAQGIQNLYACLAFTDRPDDPYLSDASLRFHTRQGYRLVGRFLQCAYKFGRWYDMIWMEKALGSHPPAPGEFVPYADMHKN